MNTFSRVIVLLLACFFSSATAAREMIISPAYQWAGLYAGAHGGFLRADQEFSIDTSPALFGKPDSAFAGLQIGYWAPLSRNRLYGFEADISIAGSDSDAASGVRTQFDRFGTARTRIGYANGPPASASNTRFLPCGA